MNTNKPRTTEVRNEFPLLLMFNMIHPIDRKFDRLDVIGGFRDWEHYKTFVKQMFDRNAIAVKKPRQLDEEYNVKIIH